MTRSGATLPIWGLPVVSSLSREAWDAPGELTQGTTQGCPPCKGHLQRVHSGILHHKVTLLAAAKRKRTSPSLSRVTSWKSLFLHNKQGGLWPVSFLRLEGHFPI